MWSCFQSMKSSSGSSLSAMGKGCWKNVVLMSFLYAAI